MCDASKKECPSRMAVQKALDGAFTHECDYKTKTITVLFMSPFRKGTCEDTAIAHVVFLTNPKDDAKTYRCQRTSSCSS
jgi:hypothetical protein